VVGATCGSQAGGLEKLGGLIDRNGNREKRDESRRGKRGEVPQILGVEDLWGDTNDVGLGKISRDLDRVTYERGGGWIKIKDQNPRCLRWRVTRKKVEEPARECRCRTGRKEE